MDDTESLGSGGQSAETGDAAYNNQTKERGVDTGMEDTAAGGDFQDAAQSGKKRQWKERKGEKDIGKQGKQYDVGAGFYQNFKGFHNCFVQQGQKRAGGYLFCGCCHLYVVFSSSKSGLWDTVTRWGVVGNLTVRWYGRVKVGYTPEIFMYKKTADNCAAQNQTEEEVFFSGG